MQVEKMNDLVAMSNRYGKDEKYVLAGGGNTSVKDESTMYIKGSGTTLATITADQFVGVDRSVLNGMLVKAYPDNDTDREALALADLLSSRLPGNENKRPSVETMLHNIFPFTFVLHIHPPMVNGLTCGKDGKKVADELFGDTYIWVEMCRPGFMLSKLCENKLNAHKAKTGKDAQILILQNHGIFFAANTVAEIDDIVADTFAKFESRVQPKPDFSLTEMDAAAQQQGIQTIQDILGKETLVKGLLNAEIKVLVTGRDAFTPLALPFTPDHIVYCKAMFLFVDSLDDLKTQIDAFRAKEGYVPRVIAVKGVGIFIVATSPVELNNASLLLLDAVKVAAYSRFFGGASPLSEDLIYFITHWETEQYRQNVASK